MNEPKQMLMELTIKLLDQQDDPALLDMCMSMTRELPTEDFMKAEPKFIAYIRERMQKATFSSPIQRDVALYLIRLCEHQADLHAYATELFAPYKDGTIQ